MKLGEICIHKQLKRQCETCEIADERDALKAESRDANMLVGDYMARLQLMTKDHDRWRGIAEKLAYALKISMPYLETLGDGGMCYPEYLVIEKEAKKVLSLYDEAVKK